MLRRPKIMNTKCAICGCIINRGGEYATPTIQGRSHATRHHNIAVRFFYIEDRAGNPKTPIFRIDPWNMEGHTTEFCYDCHEELLHNPVFLPDDIIGFSELVRLRKLDESEKTQSREELAGRIKLLHEALETGIKILLSKEKHQSSSPVVMS